MTDVKSVTRFKIYCNTEAKYVEGWSDTSSPPTYCYNGVEHSVNSNSVQIIETVKENVVEISESQSKNHGKFHIIAVKINAPANQTTIINVPFKYTCTVYNVQFVTTSDHMDDELSVSYNPDTLVGTSTASISSNTSTIPVTASVVQNVIPGYYLYISDGNNTDALGIITDIDTVNNTVTIDEPTSHSFAEGSFIYVEYYLLHSVPLGHAGMYDLGTCVINKPTIYSGTIGRVEYKNTSLLTAKKLVIYLNCTM